MKVKLLIASVDKLYVKLLSDNISENYSDIIDVSVCNTLEGFNNTLSKQCFNVALIDLILIEHINTDQIHMPVLLWTEGEKITGKPVMYERINKHSRISLIVSSILEKYAKISDGQKDIKSRNANITAVWSPSGGVGKTCVALAYALSNIPKDEALDKKDVFYLNLENFSSVAGIFKENTKSISSVFEMLDSNIGDMEMLIKGISYSYKGLRYLGSPENYEDMDILSPDNISELISHCANLSDELVVDLSSTCDEKVKNVFEAAGKILLVTDDSSLSQTKLAVFMSQNSIFKQIQEKTILVVNKDAKIDKKQTETIIYTPFIQSDNVESICLALSEYF